MITPVLEALASFTLKVELLLHQVVSALIRVE